MQKSPDDADNRYDDPVELQMYASSLDVFNLGRRETPADFSISDIFTRSPPQCMALFI